MGRFQFEEKLNYLSFVLYEYCAAVLKRLFEFTVGKDAAGLQLARINNAKTFTGLQIGIINKVKSAKGIQFGLINVIEDGWIPFLPLVNFSF